MKSILKFVLAISVLAGSAAAQGLDAPIENKPTPRTEIPRGYEEGVTCSPQISPMNTEACFDRLRDRYRLTNSNAYAYEIGLRYRQFENASIQAQVYTKGAMAPVASSLVSISCLEVVDAAEHAGVTIAQSLEALKLGPERAAKLRACLGPSYSDKP